MTTQDKSLLLSDGRDRLRKFGAFTGHLFLLTIASLSVFAVLFIFIFIAKDAIPFFRLEGFKQFFTSGKWYPSSSPPEFGVLAIFIGSILVTIGAILVAVPLGITAAVCLSDILPFSIRQLVKPIIEILAAIPSVAYGFFALVIFAPLLQNHGGIILATGVWLIGLPLAGLTIFVLSDVISDYFAGAKQRLVKWCVISVGSGITLYLLYELGADLLGVEINSGTNALNVSIILGIMALPTVVSVSEDALQASGRELREGSYALGATRAETIIKVIIPASAGGILSAVILGIMRAMGETMVVWMASGNAAKIPKPIYNVLEPVRTLTATIAGDMGEADHVTGSARFHVLFAMALCLLAFSLLLNLLSEWVVCRSRKIKGG